MINMLQMWDITLECNHIRRLHWQPEHEAFWCLQCADMRQVLGSMSTVPDTDSSMDDFNPLVDVEWIREPTPAERRELRRVQRLIARG
jgi:hypothetical protein